VSEAPAEVETTIDYLIPTSRINRRFWAPGTEYNTGVYQPYPVTIRNARLAGPFTLDEHGFCIAKPPTAIPDREANYGGAPAQAQKRRHPLGEREWGRLPVWLGGHGFRGTRFLLAPPPSSPIDARAGPASISTGS